MIDAIFLEQPESGRAAGTDNMIQSLRLAQKKKANKKYEL